MRAAGFSYAHYPKSTFATVPQALIRVLAERQVGRNGWAVMSVLCKTVFADGRLGTAPAKRVAEVSGLTRAQVARGMRDLRERGVIAPVIRKNEHGYRHPDHSTTGHVAQYCICRDVWELVELDP